LRNSDGAAGKRERKIKGKLLARTDGGKSPSGREAGGKRSRTRREKERGKKKGRGI